MRYSLKLLAATVFLVSSPVEAVVTNNSSVTNNLSVAKSVVSEEVKIAQVQGKKQRRDEALRLNELGSQQLNRGEYREALKNFEQALATRILHQKSYSHLSQSCQLTNITRQNPRSATSIRFIKNPRIKRLFNSNKRKQSKTCYSQTRRGNSQEIQPTTN